MSILLDDGQEAIGREARRVVEAGFDKSRLLGLLDSCGEYDQVFWETAREQGWTRLGIPEELGGIELGLIEFGLVAEAAGSVTAGAPFLTTNYGAARLLQASGAQQLAQEWLPRLAEGEAIGCCALAEGNSPLSATGRVMIEENLLSGTTPAVLAGLAADFALVLAGEGDGRVIALVELAQVERTAIDSFDNSRLYADLHFARTPAKVVASGEMAVGLALESLARMAVAAAFEQMGGAEALLFVARDYANSRKAFGQPIGAFQSIKHRIAELYGLVQIARANCLHAASREGQPDFVRAAAAARLSATEAYDTAARDCVQIHGGIGVTWELGLHLHMRRARSLAVEQGNALFWEDILAAELIRQRSPPGPPSTS